MPAKVKQSLFIQLMGLAAQLQREVKTIRKKSDELNGDSYSYVDSGEDLILKQAIVILDVNIFDMLSAHAIKYLHFIIKNMKMNNVFWVEMQAEPNTRRSLAELKRLSILVPTERPGLYVINPFKLRRGKPLGSVMASIMHYAKDNSVLKLEDLRPPKKAELLNSGLFAKVLSIDFIPADDDEQFDAGCYGNGEYFGDND